jgi:hypothetical protein
MSSAYLDANVHLIRRAYWSALTKGSSLGTGR